MSAIRFDVLYEIAATFSLDYNEVCKVANSVRASRSPVVGAVGGEPKPLTDGQLLAMMLAINEERHPEITGPAKMFIHIARRIEAAHGIGVSPSGEPVGEVK